MRSEDCVFCRIAEAKATAYVLRRTDLSTAFLDLNPVASGHALVIPNEHFAGMDDADERHLCSLVSLAREIGMLQKSRLGATGFNLLAANGRSAQQSVFHLHFHVIPRFDGDSLDLWFHGRRANRDEGELSRVRDILG